MAPFTTSQWPDLSDLAWLSLYTAELLGVFSHWPGNDQALHSLISALSVMITARLLTHSLQNQ